MPVVPHPAPRKNETEREYTLRIIEWADKNHTGYLFSIVGIAAILGIISMLYIIFYDRLPL